MSLIALKDIETTKGNKLDLHNKLLRASIIQLKKKGLVREEENENVIELDELFLELYEVFNQYDKYCGNNNNPKGK